MYSDTLMRDMQEFHNDAVNLTLMRPITADLELKIIFKILQ